MTKTINTKSIKPCITQYMPLYKMLKEKKELQKYLNFQDDGFKKLKNISIKDYKKILKFLYLNKIKELIKLLYEINKHYNRRKDISRV